MITPSERQSTIEILMIIKEQEKDKQSKRKSTVDVRKPEGLWPKESGLSD